jgi:hypothetical protein
MPVFSICLVWKIARPQTRGLIAAMLCCFADIMLLFVMREAGFAAQMAGFHQAARNILPLVAAIKQHENKYGKPPDHLKALVPEFLPALPDKGFCLYDEFNYSPKEKVGNAWTMAACWSEHMCFYYYPRQNYGEDEYFKDKRWHLVEDWAIINF